MGFLSRGPSVDPERAAELLRSGEAVVVDVRQTPEWKAGRIRGSTHLPLTQLATGLSALPRDRTIITVCRSGHRSAVAARALRRAGYEVENLSGGMARWVRAGLPLEPANGRVI